MKVSIKTIVAAAIIMTANSAHSQGYYNENYESELEATVQTYNDGLGLTDKHIKQVIANIDNNQEIGSHEYIEQRNDRMANCIVVVAFSDMIESKRLGHDELFTKKISPQSQLNSDIVNSTYEITRWAGVFGKVEFDTLYMNMSQATDIINNIKPKAAATLISAGYCRAMFKAYNNYADSHDLSESEKYNIRMLGY